jgi:hypothetical protein
MLGFRIELYGSTKQQLAGRGVVFCVIGPQSGVSMPHLDVPVSKEAVPVPSLLIRFQLYGGIGAGRQSWRLSSQCGRKPQNENERQGSAQTAPTPGVARGGSAWLFAWMSQEMAAPGAAAEKVKFDPSVRDFEVPRG